MTHCATCQQHVDLSCGAPLLWTGFMLYDSTAGRAVPELDSCDRINCPHDTSPVRFSRMLHGMGSLGEEAHRHYVDDGECPF